jgi:2-haloacid dehalogenase
MPKAFVFDAYGTLFDVFSVGALCEQLFPQQGAMLAQLWRAKQLQYSLLRSLMGRHRSFWQLTEDGLVYASTSLGLNLTADGQRRLMDAYLALDTFADVGPGLEALKQQGMRLAILSNGDPDILRAVAQNAGILALLDEIVSAEEVGIFKPSPLVYDLASARMSVPAADIGFVSANSWDIAGAGSAGLMTFWVQRGGTETGEELGFPANQVIQAITDLPALVSWENASRVDPGEVRLKPDTTYEQP